MGKSPHFTEQPKEPQATEDLRDTQDGVRDNGASRDDENLPEGLRRPRKGPMSPDAGRQDDSI
jgi:hypothetical protein